MMYNCIAHEHTGTCLAKSHKDDSRIEHYPQELKEQGLFSLEVSQEGLVNVYTYLIGGSKEYRVRIFTVLPSQRTRGSRHKLKYKSFFLNVRKNIFTVTVVNTRASHPEGLCSLHPWRTQKSPEQDSPLVYSFLPLLSSY